MDYTYCDKLINRFHEDNIKKYRYFVRNIKNSADKVIRPYYCDDYEIDDIPVGVEVVDLKNVDFNQPYIFKKSEIGLFEMYRNPDKEYITGNLIHVAGVIEKVVKDGELVSLFFDDTRGKGSVWYNSLNNELLMLFGKTVFVSYDDKSYFGWPDKLQEFKRCKRTNKYNIDTYLITPILNGMRKKKNAGRFDLIDDLINERFTYDERYIKDKE